MISLVKPALAAGPPLFSRRITGIIMINLAYLVGCSVMATPQGSPLTTHVLNTGEGIPGRRLALSLHRLDSQLAVWNLLTTGTTDDDGRCPGLITREAFTPGMYKMRFETGEYFQALGQTCFYPYVEIVFNITDPTQKFHLPLLLSRFSYSTYRGS